MVGKRNEYCKLLGKSIRISRRLIQNHFQYFIGGRKPQRPNNRTVREVETVKSVKRMEDKQTLSRVVEAVKFLVEFDREIPCVKGECSFVESCLQLSDINANYSFSQFQSINISSVSLDLSAQFHLVKRIPNTLFQLEIFCVPGVLCFLVLSLFMWISV